MFLCPSFARAQEQDSIVMEPAEDFVQASVVVAGRGEEIYSALGHACLRLQCPQYDLDYIYSYEAEDVAHNVLSFFAGKLKMGVRAVPTEDYLSQYKPEGRGVKEYVLNLPLEVKQRLWQQMDQRLELPSIPYDFMNHGCAVSTLGWLIDAVGMENIEFAPWPDKYDKKARKELASDSILAKWSCAFISTFTAAEANSMDYPNEEKVVVPGDLVEVMQGMKVYGSPLLNDQPIILLEQTRDIHYSWFKPYMLALILLFLALCNLKLYWKAFRYMFLSINLLIGLFVFYLVVVSSLPCNSWNWLIIPFNPLPLLLWRWRRLWALPYAVICVVWSLGMLLYPLQMVDYAHIWLAVVMAVTSYEIKQQIK